MANEELLNVATPEKLIEMGFIEENYGTRTNDGFTFAKNRKPETDHDIAKIL